MDAVIAPRCNLSGLEQAYEKASGEIFFHAGDDLIFKTRLWDEMVFYQFRQSKDKILLLEAADGFHAPEKNFLTHGFLHRNWWRLWIFCAPYFSSDFNDTWLNEVADMIGRKIYLENLLIEHMHPCREAFLGPDPSGTSERHRKKTNLRTSMQRKQRREGKDAEKLINS